MLFGSDKFIRKKHQYRWNDLSQKKDKLIRMIEKVSVQELAINNRQLAKKPYQFLLLVGKLSADLLRKEY